MLGCIETHVQINKVEAQLQIMSKSVRRFKSPVLGLIVDAKQQARLEEKFGVKIGV